MPITDVRVGGGGARSAEWRAIQAAVYGRALSTVQAEEGAAYGAAILAGVGAGVWTSVPQACDRIVRTGSTTSASSDEKATMNEQYVRYRRMYHALRGIYESTL